MTTLSLSTVGSSWWQSSVTLTANRLFTVVLGSQGLQGWFNDTTSQSQNQVQGGFLLDVVVGQSSTVFQLLTSKDQSLLVRWDTFLVLNLRLDIVNGVRRFDFQSNSLTSQGLDETEINMLVYRIFSQTIVSSFIP